MKNICWVYKIPFLFKTYILFVNRKKYAWNKKGIFLFGFQFYLKVPQNFI